MSTQMVSASAQGTHPTGVPDAELRDAVKVYPDGTAAVDGVSFTVARGEFFSLLGPSGCGKSTSLRLLAGLEELSAGEVLIRGESMRGRPAHRRPTNMVFQRLALFPHLTVARNIAFGPRLKRWSPGRVRETVERMLELVELSGYGHRYPHQLSGGQQQRVAIARALAGEPTVLLLDEPLGALDLRLRVQMQRALKDIQHTSATTFIYVTHDQVEAMTMSDRIAVMNRGRIEQIGTPDDLYHRPATRFVATFLGDTNLFEGEHGADGRLDAGDVTLVVPGAGRLASVRPERVAVAARLARDYANRYPATLVDITFQGATVRYTARLTTGRNVIAERLGDEPLGLGVGDNVEIGFDPDVVVMVAGDRADQ